MGKGYVGGVFLPALLWVVLVIALVFGWLVLVWICADWLDLGVLLMWAFVDVSFGYGCVDGLIALFG